MTRRRRSKRRPHAARSGAKSGTRSRETRRLPSFGPRALGLLLLLLHLLHLLLERGDLGLLLPELLLVLADLALQLVVPVAAAEAVEHAEHGVVDRGADHGVHDNFAEALALPHDHDRRGCRLRRGRSLLSAPSLGLAADPAAGRRAAERAAGALARRAGGEPAAPGAAAEASAPVRGRQLRVRAGEALSDKCEAHAEQRHGESPAPGHS
mmetsp:Transcript_17508/g.52664  ORF Transcript_17508/g.52664 Transcript_17508/m.52664 type:complete len:210 (+) Transcript_17508:3-632(+)